MDYRLWEIRQPTSMIHVQVRDEDVFHVGWVVSQCA
jgi:hypothetical protein